MRVPRRRAWQRSAWPPLALIALLAVAAMGVLSGAVPLVRLGRGAVSLLGVSSASAPASPGRGAPLPPPGRTVNGRYLFTPDELRAAYGLAPLLQLGFTGKGQTVVVVVSFGSPTLQQDVAVFSRAYGLPPARVTVLAPLGTTRAFDASDPSMVLWARETEEDVETIHAIAPDAAIIVLTSPVDQTQGTNGLAQFLQLERYAVAHRLGGIVSQSWGASEATLTSSAARLMVEQWDAFLRQATTGQGITFIAASGDHGATDWADAAMTVIASRPTSNFPASDPWVTGVGGTTLTRGAAGYSETAWSDSGGGYSALFPVPSYQHAASSASRGVPDVAAIADRTASLGIYALGEWRVAAGTSGSVPFWAGLIAIADQMAGRPLGFLNPALYALAASPRFARDFYDITSGNNSYSGHGVSVRGYAAAPGWDAVTGLGTPNAALLLPDLIATTLATAPAGARR
ncbi:MAG: S53 family peptidase [Ktedonobacterales bacterium]|nr:S53 family peptidase [Ktedonobacterales bacterium]